MIRFRIEKTKALLSPYHSSYSQIQLEKLNSTGRFSSVSCKSTPEMNQIFIGHLLGSYGDSFSSYERHERSFPPSNSGTLVRSTIL